MKIQVSQDTLYQYILGHNLKFVRLAELTGLSVASINIGFKRRLINGGHPHAFTNKNIERLNKALPQLADGLYQCLLTFGSELQYTNNRGKTYDPTLIEPIKHIGNYINLTALVERVLGWNKYKKESILVTPSNKNYGCITRDDAERLNEEILSVVAVLSSYEVIPDEGSSSSSSGEPKPVENKKCTRTRATMESSYEAPKNEWDDLSLDPWERYARFHHLFPDGVIAFSVNGGYTVCMDDARLLASIDTTLQPFTDPTTGHITLWMDAAKWEQMRRACDDDMVVVTPMYREQ